VSEEAGLVRVSRFSAGWEAGREPCLKNVSLEARKGQLVGVMGPVGSGKVSPSSDDATQGLG
jgi:ABC-type multidrug transport system ATPase subunit